MDIGKNPSSPIVETTKYELSIMTMAKKREKIQKARLLHSNKLFFKQNKGQFGFIPLSPLPEKIVDNPNSSKMDIFKAHEMLKRQDKPNYLGLQIPIKSDFNPDKFFQYLHNYWDWQIPYFIKYGFPLDVDRNFTIISDKINHKSATLYPEHVDHYLKEEIKHGAILGPFDKPPIDLHTSPF